MSELTVLCTCGHEAIEHTTMGIGVCRMPMCQCSEFAFAPDPVDQQGARERTFRDLQQATGFLLSCLRSGESLSEAEEEAVRAVMNAALDRPASTLLEDAATAIIMASSRYHHERHDGMHWRECSLSPCQGNAIVLAHLDAAQKEQGT